MDSQEILRRAIDKTVVNGWYTQFLGEDWKVSDGEGMPFIYFGNSIVAGESVIFSHEWAKAYWEKDSLGMTIFYCENHKIKPLSLEIIFNISYGF